MKAYLLESYDPGLDFDKDSPIIALTPLVCYHLDKAGTKYLIPEDYYAWDGLLALEDEYYQSQLRWVDALDEFLQSNVQELRALDLRLAAMYYYYLKTMALDPLYIRCYVLNKLFGAIKPSDVVFVSHPARDTRLDFALRGGSTGLYSRVIPVFCRQNGVPLTSLVSEDRDAPPGLVRGGDPGRLRKKLGNMKTTAEFLYEYIRKGAFLGRSKSERLEILILTAAYNLGADFVIDALKKGDAVYQLSGDSIMRYSAIGGRQYLDLKTAFTREVEGLDRGLWTNAANLLAGSGLLKSVNERCGLDVSGIILPGLQYFVSEVCPQLLAHVRVFAGFYKEHRLDFVLGPFAWAPLEYAALAAANNHHQVGTVCLCHGDDVFGGKFWRTLELRNFNTVISSNLEAKENYERLRQSIGLKTRLYSSSHRLAKVQKINHLRETGKGRIRKRRVIFLPTLLTGNYCRVESLYPDTWYYRLQKALVEHLSTRREYTFVWKGLPASDAVYNPVPDFIRDSNFANIEVAANAFVDHLPSADRVICDYPSTGFYESIVAGVPTMSLYHRAFNVRKSAIDYFGNLLKPYSDIPEAIRHIDEFLDSDPELYRATIDVGDKALLDILEEIKGTGASEEQPPK